MTTSDQHIKEDIKKVLDKIIGLEKTRLHQVYDDSDEEHKIRAKKLEPIFNALELIKEQLPPNSGTDISLAPAGHMATVTIRSSTIHYRMTISTNYASYDLSGHSRDNANTHFTLEEYKSYSFSSDPAYETKKQYENPDEVLSIVLEEIGKEIASKQVLEERKKIS